jgi:hypothetical protein
VSGTDNIAALVGPPAAAFLDSAKGTVEYASEWAIDRLHELRDAFWRLGGDRAAVSFTEADAARLAVLLNAGLIEARGLHEYAITDDGRTFLQALGRTQRKPAGSS